MKNRENNGRNVNFEKYLERMTSSSEETTKGILSDFCVGDIIFDFGCGSGVLTHSIADKYPEKIIYGIDNNDKMLEYAEKNKRDNEIFCKYFPEDIKADTIIFSSVLHEIYSYPNSEYYNLFDERRVKDILREAYNRLNKNGRLIIRDGSYCEKKQSVYIKFKKVDGIYWFNRFFCEFKGPLPKKSPILTMPDGYIAPLCFVKEFLYTYTWGEKSWEREVQEMMGVYPEEKYKYILEDIGFEIELYKDFFEEGYRKYLDELVELYSADEKKIEYPNSTVLIVCNKKN